MTTRISEVIHQWLGWCPGRRMTLFRKEMTWQEMNSHILSAHGALVHDKVIVDSGSTGLSIRLFTLILAGTIAGLFAIVRYGLFETWSFIGLLILSIFILGVATWMAYQDIKKVSVEFTPDAIAIKRPLFGPLIIAKDAITTIGVRKNIHHSHRWLFRGAMAIFLVGVIPTILFSGHALFISRIISRVSFMVFVGYYLAVIVFLWLLFYHGYIRSRYSQLLAIDTNNKKIVALYVDDPGTISDVLSRWRTGAA